jgi:hypothetical protein
MTNYPPIRPRRPIVKHEPIKIDEGIPLDSPQESAVSIEEDDEVMENLEIKDAAPPVVRRPDQRPSLRPDNSRELAAKRAAEIMGALGGIVEEGNDKFFIDPSSVPNGWDYNWKRKSVYGMEDPAYQVSLARTGWEPVPTERHPTMMPTGNYPVIERDGMVLMMRPKVISERFEMAEKKKAREQVKFKEQQLNQNPDGQFGRDHREVQPRIKKAYEAIPIPND